MKKDSQASPKPARRDLPRRNEVALKKSKLAPEDDTKWFLIGVGAITIAGLLKVFLIDKIAPPE